MLQTMFPWRQHLSFWLSLLSFFPLLADEEGDHVQSFILLDERMVNVISIYEKLTGEDLVVDLEYSYPINYNSRGPLSKAQLIQVLKALIEIQGVQFEREGDNVRLKRVSNGQFLVGPDPGVEGRIPDLLAGMRKAGSAQPDSCSSEISHIVLKNESVFQVLSLVSTLADSPILYGPGFRRARVNWKAANITKVAALLEMDKLLVEQGVYIVEDGGFLKALVRKPTTREIPSIQGVGVPFQTRSTSVIFPDDASSKSGVVPVYDDDGNQIGERVVPRRRVVLRRYPADD